MAYAANDYTGGMSEEEQLEADGGVLLTGSITNVGGLTPIFTPSFQIHITMKD